MQLTMLYFLNALVLLAGFLWGLQRRRIYSIFWLALLTLHFVSLLNFDNLLNKFSNSSLIYGQILMIIANSLFFLIVICLDLIILQKRRVGGKNYAEKEKQKGLNRYLIVIIVLLIVSFLIRLRGGTSILLSNWVQIRETEGLLDSLSTMLVFISTPALWILIKKRNYLLAILITLFLLFHVQISGSRAIFLVLGCAIIIDIIISSTSVLKKSFLLLILGIVLFVSHTFLRLTRGLGVMGFLTALSSGFQNTSFKNIDISGGESQIYLYYYNVIEKDYDKYPYKTGVTLRRLALLYLPREIFPEIKPVDITYYLWTDFLDENPDLKQLFKNIKVPGCVHPTIWGDAYVNVGAGGILLYPVLFGFAIVLIEYFITNLSSFSLSAISPIIGIGYMAIGRGNVVIGCGYIGYMVPMIILLLLSMRIPLFAQQQKPTIAPQEIY
ncbi:MAG: hypothetical protein AB1393_03560 [Candidatus Edwardsbacteria bacterium]